MSFAIAAILSYVGPKLATRIVLDMLPLLVRGVAGKAAGQVATAVAPHIAEAISKAAKGKPLTEADKAALEEHRKTMPDYFGVGGHH